MRDLTLAATLDTINVPEDMDALTATTGGADRPIQDPLQGLGNHSLYTRDGLLHSAVSGVRAGSAGGSFQLDRLQRVWMSDGKHYDGDGLTASFATLVPAGMTANARYHVYVYVSSGALALEVSATAPGGATKLGKGSDLTRRWLTSVVARTSTNVYPFHVADGHYLYLRGYDGRTLDDWKVLSAGNATGPSYTTVDVSTFIPLHATQYQIELEFRPRNGNTDAAYFHAHDQATAADRIYAYAASTDDPHFRVVEFTNESQAQSFDYFVSDAGCSLNAYVRGFRE